MHVGASIVENDAIHCRVEVKWRQSGLEFFRRLRDKRHATTPHCRETRQKKSISLVRRTRQLFSDQQYVPVAFRMGVAPCPRPEQHQCNQLRPQSTLQPVHHRRQLSRTPIGVKGCNVSVHGQTSSRRARRLGASCILLSRQRHPIANRTGIAFASTTASSSKYDTSVRKACKRPGKPGVNSSA